MAAMVPTGDGMTAAAAGAAAVAAAAAAATQASLKAGKKSATCWITTPAHPPRLVWASWLADGICFVTGGGEQEIPGLPAGTPEVTVALPAATAGGDLVVVTATAEVLPPDGELWPTVAAALAERRLNAAAPADLVARWAVEATLIRLTVTGAQTPE